MILKLKKILKLTREEIYIQQNTKYSVMCYGIFTKSKVRGLVKKKIIKRASGAI